MFDYLGLKGTAADLIERFGRKVKLIPLENASPPDATKPWEPGDFESESNVSATYYAVFSSYEVSDLNDSILSNDKKVIIADPGFVIDTEIRIYDTDASVYYSVVSARIIEPGDTVLYYEVQVRA